MHEKIITNCREEFVLKTKKDILDFWRKLHFLDGLNEGSQNEWRCAKSFDLMANYLNDNKQYSSFSYTFSTFPLIRRLICSERPRCHRIIKPNEIIVPMNTVKIGEMLKEVDTLSKKKTYKADAIVNFIKYRNLLVMTISEFLDYCEGNPEVTLLNHVIDTDIQATLFAIYTKYLSKKLGK